MVNEEDFSKRGASANPRPCALIGLQFRLTCLPLHGQTGKRTAGVDAVVAAASGPAVGEEVVAAVDTTTEAVAAVVTVVVVVATAVVAAAVAGEADAAVTTPDEAGLVLLAVAVAIERSVGVGDWRRSPPPLSVAVPLHKVVLAKREAGRGPRANGREVGGAAEWRI
jgi:hypothetical protein